MFDRLTTLFRLAIAANNGRHTCRSCSLCMRAGHFPARFAQFMDAERSPITGFRYAGRESIHAVLHVLPEGT
jgi:hypothetical protein